MTSLTEALKTAAVTTVVEIGPHLYFVCGAPCICALQRHAPLVLVSVGYLLTGTALGIPVELRHWHDGSRVLKERRQSLPLRY